MGGNVLSMEQIKARLAEAATRWKYEDEALRRQLVFKDFREAVAFLVLLAFDAEEADHHPDVVINYRRLNFSLSTHSAGGVTEKDFALAQRIDRIFDAHRWGKPA